VIQEEGFNVHNMHNIEEKNLSISITPVRSREGSLVREPYAFVNVMSEANLIFLATISPIAFKFLLPTFNQIKNSLFSMNVYFIHVRI
jgi:hypothetical protein